MDRTQIKAVCIDVDGTLVGPAGEPTQAVWNATEQAREAGLTLAMCTARPASGAALQWAGRLQPSGWHVFHNGAALVNLGDGTKVEQPLDDAVVSAVRGAAADQGWEVEFYSADDLAIEQCGTLATHHADLLGSPLSQLSVAELGGAIVRIQFLVPKEVELEVYRAVPRSVEISTATSPVMPEGTCLVSLTAGGTGKHKGLEMLSRLVDADISEVMMVGDGHNDVDALSRAGIGVAMGNAAAAAKEVADIVVGDVTGDGLVEALEIALSLLPT